MEVYEREHLYVGDETGDTPKRLTLRPTFSGEYFSEVVQYPIVVEMWKHKLKGRVRKAYHEQFNEAERETIGRWHTAFARWHLQFGVPVRVTLQLRTLELLQRAVQFFATI